MLREVSIIRALVFQTQFKETGVESLLKSLYEVDQQSEGVRFY